MKRFRCYFDLIQIDLVQNIQKEMLKRSNFQLIHKLFTSNSIKKQFFCSAHRPIDEPIGENEATASFGFKTVRESEKADKGM